MPKLRSAPKQTKARRFGRTLFGGTLLLWACGLSMSCSGVTKANYVERLWNAQCKLIYETCCKGKSLNTDVQALFGTDLKSCQNNYSKTLTSGTTTINFKTLGDKLAASDAVDFNATEAANCLELFKGNNCGNVGPSLANGQNACGKVYTGKRKEGEDCPEGFECAPGYACQNSQCVALLKEGEACEVGGKSCDFGAQLRCDFQQQKVCAKRVPRAGACQNTECELGLTCTNGFCELPPNSTTLCQ